MNSWSNKVFGRLPVQERVVLKVQLLVLFLISTLVYIGVPDASAWRRLAAGERVHLLIIRWDGLVWYIWLVAAPFMLLMIQRYPLSPPHFRRNLGMILLWSFGLYLAVNHLRYLLRLVPNIWLVDRLDVPIDWQNYLYNTFRLWPTDLLTYCGFFAVSFSIDYYFQIRQRTAEAHQFALRTAQLESDLARAELAALRGQLHPHFLFNSFNAVASLVRQHKNEAAVEVIAQLSDLLRLAIDRTGLQEIPLEQEIDFIRRYLEIEQVRFGDKLRVEILTDPSVFGSWAPNLVLQPLVENAIKHGISRRIAPGVVRIEIGRSGDRLKVEITNDAPEAPGSVGPAGRPAPIGIGWANTRARLDRLYGTDYRFEIVPTGERAGQR